MLLDTILGYAASLVMVLQGISLLSVTYTSPDDDLFQYFCEYI